jgi:predicted Zn-dependent peptidase
MIPKIHVYQNKLANPKFSFVAIIIFTGSIFENPEEKGISHFIEHLIFKGSKYSTNLKNLNDKLNHNGMKVNAATSNLFTYYYISTPNIYIKEAIATLIQIVCNPLFREEDINNERKVVINELLERMNNPQSFAAHSSLKIIYKEKNPFYNPIIGYIPILEKITQKDILDYYHKFYIPQNIFFFTSTYKPKATIEKIWRSQYKLFASAPSNYQPQMQTSELFNCLKPLLSLYNPSKTINLSKNFPSNTSYFVAIKYILPKCTIKEQIAFNIFTNYLTGGLSSLLFTELRDKKQLIYSIVSFSDSVVDIQEFGIQFNCKKNKKTLKTCLTSIDKELKNFFKNGMPKKEYEKFKNKTVFNYERSESSGTKKMYEIIEKYYYFTPKYNFHKEIKSITNNFIHKTVTNKLKDKSAKKFIIVV